MEAVGASLLSERVRKTLGGRGESWIRQMFEKSAQLRAQGGGPVFDLSLGNPSLEPPQVWKEAIRELLATEPPGMHRYISNAGLEDVRRFIAQRESNRYELPFTLGDIVMTTGAAAAMNVLMRVTLDPGDRVVVPSPYFVEYGHYCANVGAEFVAAPTEEGFQPSLAQLERVLSEPRARWLVLNSPNNPTGAIYDASHLDEIAALLERLNRGRTRPIIVVEDNPYRDLVYDGSDPPSMLTRYAHTIFVTSHSKDLGLAGERIGYLAISPRIQDRHGLSQGAALANRVLGFVNAPALMQRVLPKVLADPTGKVDVAVYQRLAERMAEGLLDLGFHLVPPRAGFFLFPRLPDTLPFDDIELTHRLLDHRTVVVPGAAFGMPRHLRLSMATDEASVHGALAAFRTVCASA